jgi:hypothetical protein
MVSGDVTSDDGILRYEPISPLTRQDALRRIVLGGNNAANAIYSIALHDEDDAFAEAICLTALDSDDAVLRGAAVGALGEMAFVARRMMDFSLVESKLLKLQEKYPELVGRIEDALGDIALAKNRNPQTSEGEK